MIDHPAGPAVPAPPMDLGAPRSDRPPRLPERVGPFRVVGVLGVGGMGVVYDAEQSAPHRRVALKVIRDVMLHDAEGVRRFAREAEVLARLQHPGIAQVYATGVAESPHGPQPYFAMERVVGEPLGPYAARLDRRARLKLFARVCDAVHYAHQRGVIHRDLKPANILVGDDGQPKVLDFGVARLTDADVQGAAAATRGLTATGDVVGTLLYMSPEQLLGDPLGVDTRSDVYALGVILYELLAGRLPHEQPRGGKLVAVAHAVLAADPPALGTLDRELRGDLETIAAKALEKEPAHRYASAAALAADVRHYLAHEPITARPVSAVYQLRKLARRHRGVVVASGVAVVALMAGAAASVVSAVRARAAERVAVAQRRRAEDALGLAERRRLVADAERTRADSARAAALRERGLAVSSAARASAEAARASAEAGKATAVSDFLVQMLVSADPAVARGRELTVRQVLDSAAERVNAPGPLDRQPAVRGAVLATLARSYRSLGAMPPARAAAESALAVQTRTPGVGDDALVRTERVLGDVLVAAGDRSAAWTHYTRALARARRAHPVDRPEEALLLQRLGTATYLRGDLATADSLLDAAVTLGRRTRQMRDTLLAQLLAERARIYSNTNRPALAVAPLGGALALTQRAYGDLHPAVVDARAALGWALNRAGRRREGVALLRQALSGARVIHGTTPHPRTAAVLVRLGRALLGLDELPEAELRLREGMAMQLAMFGPARLELGETESALARIYAETGRYAAAESLYTQALTVRRANFGPGHPAVAATHRDIGRFALQRGDFAAAERELREALGRFDALGDVWFAIETRLLLAQTAFAAGRDDDGEREAVRARALLHANPGRRSGVIALQLGAAAAFAAGRRPALADSLAADALAVQRGLLPAGDPSLAVGLLTLAAARADGGDTAGVAALLREADALRAGPSGAADEPARDAAAIGIARAAALCATGRGAEGAPALERAAAAEPPSSLLRAWRALAQRALARCSR